MDMIFGWQEVQGRVGCKMMNEGFGKGYQERGLRVVSQVFYVFYVFEFFLNGIVIMFDFYCGKKFKKNKNIQVGVLMIWENVYDTVSETWMGILSDCFFRIFWCIFYV